MSGPAVSLEGVEKFYGRTPVLRGISLSIDAGDFLSVMGSSGSGKSTLLNLIGGMDRPDRGRIVVRGEDLSAFSEERLTLHRRERVGFIFQFFNLLPNITVFENVEMPLLLQGAIGEERVRELVERVGLGGREQAYPHELSGGQQQRVAIARALIHDPEIILADEPTGSLDSETGSTIMDLLAALAGEAGKTVVLVTHDENVARYANRHVRIRDGRLVP